MASTLYSHLKVQIYLVLLILLLLTQYETFTTFKTWISNVHYHLLVPLYLKALCLFFILFG